VIDTAPRVLTVDQREGLAQLARQVTVLLELRESIHQLHEACRDLELAHCERGAAEARLWHGAHYNALTGLPNRTLLMERVETAFAASPITGRPVAMLICDVDDFKLVNDGLGHPAGDQLLVEIAHRLRPRNRHRRTLRRRRVCRRDERRRPTHRWSARRRILDEIAAPIMIGAQADFRPSISIGVAFQTPGANGDQLLSNADAAMYRAKSLGGGRMCPFDAALHSDVVDRLTITTDVRTALTNDELFCLHQPEIDLLDGHLFGLESLVRWRHPTRGILSPDLFVPILEASNGIFALFDRVLHLSLEAQAGWFAELGTRPTVAVNLSARQLHDPNLADTIRTALARFSAPTEALCLEVTESALASPRRSKCCTTSTAKGYISPSTTSGSDGRQWRGCRCFPGTC